MNVMESTQYFGIIVEQQNMTHVVQEMYPESLCGLLLFPLWWKLHFSSITKYQNINLIMWLLKCVQ